MRSGTQLVLKCGTALSFLLYAVWLSLLWLSGYGQKAKTLDSFVFTQCLRLGLVPFLLLGVCPVLFTDDVVDRKTLVFCLKYARFASSDWGVP